MPDIWAGLAGRMIADHELNFLCEIDGVPLAGPGLRIAALAEGDPGCWPPDQLPAMRGRYAAEPVWAAREGDAHIGDFHPHVGRLVNGSRPDLMRVFEPTEQTRRLLATADLYEQGATPGGQAKKRIEIELSTAAKGRLADHGVEPRPLRLTVDSIRLHVFATGKSFAVVKVTVAAADGPPNALELLEAQNALGRVHKLVWVSALGGVPLASFGLTELVGRLALGRAVARESPERISTCSFAQLEGATSAEESDFYGLHLARHYTTDYAVSPIMRGVEWVAAFATVRTAVASEGAATIVGRAPGQAALPSFLDRFKTVTFRRHYLPIALLAIHERAFLVDRMSRAILDRRTLDEPATLASLRQLLSDALTFRLGFRFAELSYISMHNEVNHAFRRVMSLDRMLKDLGDDVAAVEGFLSFRAEAERAEAAHRMERNFYWTSVLGAMALSGLTTFTIVKEAVEVFLGEGHLAGRAAVVAGLAVAIGALIIGLWRRPPPHAPAGHGAGHFTRHAMTENMIHLAGRATKGRGH